MLYQGFISYSHAADDKLAPALQRGLHTLAKPWYRRRALKVFRDKTSLSANPALWPAIEQALIQSEWFLFMASPLAARSAWVQKELQWWLEHRTSDKMLMLLTDGELSWDGGARDFDWHRTTSVPNVLQGRFPDEPLYVDLRWARKEDSLSIRHSQFRGAILDIAAPLHGKAKDELDGEDVRQHRRNKTWAWSAGSALLVLTVLAIGAAFYAFEQRNEAIAQRDLAQGRQLRAEAQRLAPTDSQWTTAALLAVESVRRTEDADTYETLWKLVSERARPVARFIGKEGGGAALAFSPDGQYVATGEGDAVMVFPARGGGEARPIPFPGWPRFIGFNAAGDQIVIAGDDSVRVFALASGKEIARRDSGVPESKFGFSPDAQLLVVASGASVTMMESFTGRPIAAADIPVPVDKVVVGPSGKAIALISGKTAWLLDTATGQIIALPERKDDVSSVAFSADGKLAAVASWGGKEEVTIVDVASGEIRDRVALGSSEAWFSPQGNLLVTQEGYPSLAVRDLDEKGNPTVLALPDSARNVDWSEDGEFLVVGTGDRDGSTSVFQVGSWRPLARWKHQGMVAIEAVAIGPDGDLVASRANKTTTIFQANQDVPLVHMSAPGELGRTAFSADGKTIAGVFDKDDLYLFGADADRPPVPAGQCKSARGLTLTPDGSRLVAGCYDGTARIVDGSTGALVGEVPHSFNTRLAISSDGTMVFSVGPQGATVFKVADGSTVRVIGGDSITAVAFSPSGSRLVIASGSTGAEVFETFGDQPPVSVGDEDLLESVAFSPDGRRVALGARSRYANVYDIATGARVAALDHKEEEREVLRVASLVFSDDGALLASVAVDPTQTPGEGGATLRVFEVSTEKELIRVPLPEIPHFIAFSPDGAFLQIDVGNRHLRLERFPIRARDLIDEACERVGRDLNDDEKARYLGDASYPNTCTELNPAARFIQ